MSTFDSFAAPHMPPNAIGDIVNAITQGTGSGRPRPAGSDARPPERTRPSLPTHSAPRLAQALKALDLPGKRSGTAITALRRERVRSRQDMTGEQLDRVFPAGRRYHGRDTTTPPAARLRARLDARLQAQYVAEIRRRGGETIIEGRYDPFPLEITDRVRVRANDRDRTKRMAVLHADGWRQYSRRFGAQRARLSYLCGWDDNGVWAVRVAGTITTVREALDAITPAAVKQALDKGKRVLRQGDVYAIETTKAHDGLGVDELGDAHVWNAETRTLEHRPADGRTHQPLPVPFPARFVRQRAYEMGRTSARGDAD